MKKFILTILCTLIMIPSVYATENKSLLKFNFFNNDTREIKSLINSQVKYANKTNFKKYIATYDKNYINHDGFNLETYSDIVKDVWNTYEDIEYGIIIKDIEIDKETAKVEVVETSFAYIPLVAKMNGVLKGKSNSIYYLKKIDGSWKVASDKILNEETSLLYGDAQTLDIKLSAPNEIKAGEEYTASLEFTPPEDSIAIASITCDEVKYPQEQSKEVYRKLPEDNLLERLFISNSHNVNEYIIAAIGLTKADFNDTSIKLSLTGYGYKIIRVNVLPSGDKNVEEK